MARRAIIRAMLFPQRIIAVICLLLCQACSHLDQRADAQPVAVAAHQFHFDDGGKALYFVLDKRPRREVQQEPNLPPQTFMFVIAGSDCTSMQGMLPEYFNGLESATGTIRILILHKRFITAGSSARCSDAFMREDHPSRWIADQSEFIRYELTVAKAGNHAPKRIVLVGISEGAEIAPLLARRIPEITHVALLANGGMDPFDAYRIQAQRYGFLHALEDIGQQCLDRNDSADTEVAERSCRYWRELRAIRHTDNLLALDMPVFIAMGEADTMVPVESAFLIRDKFAAHHKENLRLVTFAETGHDFRRRGETVLPYLWDDLERWLRK